MVWENGDREVPSYPMSLATRVPADTSCMVAPPTGASRRDRASRGADNPVGVAAPCGAHLAFTGI